MIVVVMLSSGFVYSMYANMNSTGTPPSYSSRPDNLSLQRNSQLIDTPSIIDPSHDLNSSYSIFSSPSIVIINETIYGLNVSVNGTASPSSSNTIVYVEWEWGDGTSSNTWTPYNLFPARHSYDSPGTYKITATAYQSDGETAETSAFVNLSGQSSPPYILLQQPYVYGLNVTVNGIAGVSVNDTSITSIKWSWGDGSYSNSTGFPSSHEYSIAGTYFISATVYRSDGRSASNSEWVSVNNSLQSLWQPIGPKYISSSIPNSLSPNSYTAERSPPNGELSWNYSVDYVGFPASGKINAFAIDPSNSSIMYAGGGTGPGNQGPYSDDGLFKSIDGGDSWFPLINGFTGKYIDRIWIDPSNTSIVVVGTYDQGLFYSGNSGVSWKNVYSGTYPPAIHAVVEDGSVLLATEGPLLLKSLNFGLDWSVIWSIPSGWFTTATVNHGTVWLGLTNGTVYKGNTTIGTWSATLVVPSLVNGVSSISINSTDPSNVYVTEVGVPNHHIYVTTNGGVTWTYNWTNNDAISSQVNSGVNILSIDPSNPSIVFAGADGAVWESVDSGHIFSPNPLYDLDVRGIYIYNNSTIVITGDQGAYMSWDGGLEWKSLSGDLTNALLASLAVTGNKIFTTAQDWSPIVSYDGGLEWSVAWNMTAPAAEVGSVAINPANSSDIYFFTGAGFQRSTDGGKTFTYVPTYDPSVYGTIPTFYPPVGESNLIGVNPTHPNIVYVASYQGVYESTNWGASFTKTTWPFPHANVVAVDPQNSDIIFVGNYTGFYYSINGGLSWNKSILPTDVSTLSPWHWINSLAFDPINSSIMFIGTEGGSYGQVLKSTNGGVSFTDVTGVISGFQANPFGRGIVLAFEPNSTYLAAATTSGIFVSSNLGSTWTQMTRNAISTAFSGVQWSGNYLYASTYGEGVLRMPLPSVPTNLTISGISGQTVSLKWNPPESEVWNYTVNYGLLGSNIMNSVTINGKTAYATISGLKTGDSYTFEVSTTGPAGISSPSAPVEAYLMKTYFFNVTETGLPSGTVWFLNFSNGQEYSSTTNSISVPEPNGSYYYSITTTNRDYKPTPSSGSFTISGSSITETVIFHQLVYSLKFLETGLPSSTLWSVDVNGTSQYSTSSVISFSVSNGTYYYNIPQITGYTVSPQNGRVTVSGSNLSEVISFTSTFQNEYNITFIESGLGSGSNWYVDLNGSTKNSTSDEITFVEPNGTYTYHVLPPPGAGASPLSGNITVDGSNVGQTVHFSPSFLRIYSVTFYQIGLPSGITWSVTLKGTSESSVPNITFSVPNGTYSYSVASMPGYNETPPTGSVTVNGHNVSLQVTFTRNNEGYFVPTVIPENASLYINGTLYQRTGILFATPAGNSGGFVEEFFNISLPPGTYLVKITAPGYSNYTTTITITSLLTSIHPNYKLEKISEPSSSVLLEAAIIAFVIVIIAAISTMILMRGRKRYG